MNYLNSLFPDLYKCGSDLYYFYSGNQSQGKYFKNMGYAVGIEESLERN